MTTSAIATPEVTPRLQTTEIRLGKVLVAIDFSQQTAHTLDAAIAIGKSFGSELILVNAATPGVYGTGAEPVPIETFEVNLEIAKAMMTELVQGCQDLQTMKHREIVTYFPPVDLIEQVAKD